MNQRLDFRGFGRRRMIWIFWDFNSETVIFFATSHLELRYFECFREFGGDGEGVVLLEWPVDLGLLAILSQALLLAPKC